MSCVRTLPRALAVLSMVAVVCAAAVGGRDLAQYGDEIEDGLVRSSTDTARFKNLFLGISACVVVLRCAPPK